MDKLQYQEVMDKRVTALRHKQSLDRMTSLEKTMVSSLRQLVSYLDGKTTKTEVVNQLKEIGTPDILKVVKALEKLDTTVSGAKLDISPLIKGLDKLEKQLSELPKNLPEFEQREDVKVSNLSEIDLKPIEKAIKALKLDPKLNIAAPDVRVEAPDLKPLQSSMLDVVDAIKSIPQPEKTDTSTVEKQLKEANEKLQKIVDKRVGGSGGGGNGTPYTDPDGKATYVETQGGAVPTTQQPFASRLDDSSDPVLYIGKAPVGSDEADPVWQIAKLDTSSGLTKTWADNAGFTQVWADRTSLTYQ